MWQPKNRPVSSSRLRLDRQRWIVCIMLTFSIKDHMLFAAVILYIMYVAMQPWLTAPRPPRPPSHFALIQRWLDKNMEQTSGGFRRSQVSHAG